MLGQLTLLVLPGILIVVDLFRRQQPTVFPGSVNLPSSASESRENRPSKHPSESASFLSFQL
jgi:hypothetical protein